MSINMDEKNGIIYVCSPDMSWLSLLRLKAFMFMHKNLKIALDMKFVKNIKQEFLDVIKSFSEKNRLSVYNLRADLMAIFGLRDCDKYVNIYATESDFWENSRAMVNRRFKVY